MCFLASWCRDVYCRCARAGGTAMRLLACDAVFATLFSLLLVAVCAKPAFAYVDPSVMTYTIQALAGVAVALSAVLGVMWRRVRKKLLFILQIDENAGKEVEGDVHRVDPSCAVAESFAAAPCVQKDGNASKCDAGKDDAVQKDNAAGVSASSPARAGKLPSSTKQHSGASRSRGSRKSCENFADVGALAKNLKWKNRIVYAAIVAVFLVFTVLVVAPYELVSGASGSLVLGLKDVWLPVAVAGFACAVCLALAASLLRGRVFDIALLVLFAVGLCAYVQVVAMNTALPSADGKAVDWGSFAGITALSAFVWLAVAAAVLALGHRRRLLARTGVAAASVFLVLVQAVGVAGLFFAPVQDEGALGSTAAGEPIRVTQEGLFDVSDKSNVVVFVLDMFDTRQAQHLIEQHPESVAGLGDFTLFTNVTGSMIPTRYAVPYLLTGETPYEGELFSQYLSARYERSSFLGTINQAGYSVGLYSDTLGLEYASSAEVERVAAVTENLHEVRSPRIDNTGAVLALWKCALYRDAPWLFKPLFWFYTDEVNNAMVVRDGEKPEDENSVYTIDDARYYQKLCERGLSVKSQGSGAFRFIHLLGAHYPYSMDENAQDVGVDNSTKDAQSLGALHIVEEYVQQLKDAGVYDATTIIVTADHGEWYCAMELDEPTSPLLMVKPSSYGDGVAPAGEAPLLQEGMPGAEDESRRRGSSPAEEGLRVCDVAVSHMDFQAAVFAAMGFEGEGYSLLDLARGEEGNQLAGASAAFEAQPRRYFATTSDGKHDQQIVEYEITGHALDFASWHKTGALWDAQK